MSWKRVRRKYDKELSPSEKRRRKEQGLLAKGLVKPDENGNPIYFDKRKDGYALVIK